MTDEHGAILASLDEARTALAALAARITGGTDEDEATEDHDDE